MIVKVLNAHCWSSRPFSFKLNLKKLLFRIKYSFKYWSFFLTAEDVLRCGLFRPCLVGINFFVFSIQTFRKQGKYV